jgi:acyl-CoA thioesterase-2
MTPAEQLNGSGFGAKLAVMDVPNEPHIALAELISLLAIEQLERDVFRAHHPAGRQHRLYGGQIMAQALMGAARTVAPERSVHSLHGYFLRPGDPGVPALVQVERLRDGRSFSTRRVVVIQHGRAIFNLDASFQIQESGFSHGMPFPPGAVEPTYAMVPTELKERAFLGWRHDHKRLRSPEPQPPEQLCWFRTNGPVPDDPVLHACLLVFESDNALLATARLPHRHAIERERLQVASLDHAMWFHEAARADQWLLHAIDSPASAGARGYNRGTIFTPDGRTVASTMQEGLMRVRG